MSTLTPGLCERNPTKQIALAEWTTMRVGGPATLVQLEELDDLPELVDHPIRWLGKGANLLVGPAGVPETVVKLGDAFKQLQFTYISSTQSRVQVGAAFDLARLVAQCARRGLAGPEGLAGVPATLGGALRMNAGTTTCWTFDWVDRVQVLLPGEAEVRWLERAEVPAVYRDSGLPVGTVFLAVELVLRHEDPQLLQTKASELKQKKAATQPLTAHSAGCIFKNPAPDLPAGKLIDELGLKGERVGAAVVSEQHGNFIINEGTATAADVCALIRKIRHRAWTERAVALEIEVQTWGCPADLLDHPEATDNSTIATRLGRQAS